MSTCRTCLNLCSKYKGVTLHFCDCLQKAVQVICYRIRELDMQFPQNLLCFIPWHYLEEEEEKVTNEISEYLTAVSYSLFSTLRCMQGNLSCWASARVCTMSVVWVRAVLLNSSLATTHPSVWVKCLWCRWFMQLWGSFWWCTSLGSAHKNSELCDHLISWPFNTLDRLCSKSLFLVGFVVIL